jgi:hypothetical protein
MRTKRRTRRAATPLLLLIGLVAMSPRSARAVLCTVDNVPAATLLLPYFEVDLSTAATRSTLMSITNASAQATLAHVVLWTDWAVPTLAFDVYLTGYDVQTMNLRDVLEGNLPVTADRARDPDDAISPEGPLSQDSTFPGCAGLLPPPPLSTIDLATLQRAHQGLSQAVPGGLCSGQFFGDGLLRGYVTVDAVTRCSQLFPGAPGYFGPGGVAGYANVLVGDFFYLGSQGPSAAGFNLVRIEADPVRFGPGSRTFYSSLVRGSGADGREPLPAVWATRYFNGGAFVGETDVIVWREDPAPGQYVACGSSPPSTFPMGQAAIVALDEQEHAVTIPAACNPNPCQPPPPAGEAFPFPLAANHLRIGADHPNFTLPFAAGWLLLNLDRSPDQLDSQAWVGVVLGSDGGFQLGFDGTPLLGGCAVHPPKPF